MTQRTIALAALCFATIMAITATESLAQRSAIETKISRAGLETLGPVLASQLPNELTLPRIETDLYECSGEDASIAISSRQLAIEIHELTLQQSAPGQLEVALRLSATTAGQVDFNRALFCGSSFTCQDSLALRNMGATVLLESGGTTNTLSDFRVVDVQLDLDAERFDFSLSGCEHANLANAAIDLVETLGVSILANLVESLIRDKLAPAIQGAATGLSASSLDLLRWQLEIALQSLDLSSGIRVVAQADIRSEQGAAPCLQDPGEPRAHQGTAPAMHKASDMQMSLNLGLMDDLLYHIWSSSAACPGLVSDANFIGNYLPGFPEGTRWNLQATVLAPPYVEGTEADGLSLAVVFDDIEVQLEATLPNGSTTRALVAIDARAVLDLAIDPSASAIALQVHSARVTRLTMDDELQLSELGFDAARITDLINEVYLPQELASYLESDLRLPLAIGLGRAHLILRELRSNAAFVSLGLDFFLAPENDTSPPETEIVSAPTTVVRASQALVYLSGQDSQIPRELLRYQVRINGVEMPLASTSRLQVGLQNFSATYDVEIAAVDLAGNVDPSPASVHVEVDGVRPTLAVHHEFAGDVLDLAFEANDDRSPLDSLRARISVIDTASGLEVATRQLPAGQTTATLESLAPGREYRVTVVVVDEVGNQGAESFVVAVHSAGGCAITGSASSTGALLLLTLLLLSAGRRRSLAGLLLAIAVGGAGCAQDGHTQKQAQTVALPECASALAHDMWTAMHAVSERGTLSMESAIGSASHVDPKLYIDGPAIFSKWASLIEDAEVEIDMQFYKWEPNTDATETILGGIRALQDRRKREGATQAIAIRILIDTSALGVAAPVSEEHMPLVMERIEAYEIDPTYVDLRFSVLERGFLNQFGNLHVKTMVVDGGVAIITGANPEHQHNFDAPWHDLATVFYGDIVRAVRDDFDYSYQGAQRWACSSHSADREACLVPVEMPTRLVSTAHAFASTGKAPNACAILALSRTPSPTSNNSVDNPQDQAFLAAFAGATQIIKIETPNINDDAVKAAILDAVQRGVEVRLITSKGFNETSEGFVGGPNGANVAELYRDLALLGTTDACKRLQVRWYSRDGQEAIVGNGAYASHTKYSSFDDQLVIVGTTNMDTASWNFSHELNLAIDDAAMAKTLDAQLFDADWTRAVVSEPCADERQGGRRP